MTNQLNLSPQNVNSNWTKLWLFSKILLFSLLATMLFTAIVSAIPTVYFLGFGLMILFLSVFFLLKHHRKPAVNVKVENQQLQYFCPVKKENICIPTSEIVKVTSQFCELQIHTFNRTYCLNLNNIRQEKQRWEIKEMIKKLAPNQANQVINF